MVLLLIVFAAGKLQLPPEFNIFKPSPFKLLKPVTFTKGPELYFHESS